MKNRAVNIAYKATVDSTHPEQQMAAVVMRGGSILSVAANGHQYGAHCERRALRPHNNYVGATIIVVRSNGGCSKPCIKCQRLIITAGIKRVVYVNRNGQLVVENQS